MREGQTSTLDFTVGDEDTAAALGSGDLPVLGTPRLVAWLEAATCAAVADSLPAGGTTVGTRVAVEHKSASAVGAAVRARATLARVDGRTLEFEVAATDPASGAVLGEGRITRVVVDQARFLGRIRHG